MAPLKRRSLTYAVEGGGVETLIIEHSRDTVELMMAVLRKTRGRVFFHFNGTAPEVLAA
jgi:hypothetical protein